MIDPQMITNPPHYVKSRKIEPIRVIEEWSLCHHLACVVKYIARMGRKKMKGNNLYPHHASLEDLKKAEWYLLREIGIKNCSCIPNPRWFPMTPEAIAKDWRLSTPLSQVIVNLTTYQRLFNHFSLTRVVYLEQALTHLKVEINAQESKIKEQDKHPVVLGENVIIFTRRKPCNN